MLIVNAVYVPLLAPFVAIVIFILSYFILGRIRMMRPSEIRFGIFKNGKGSKRISLRMLLYVRFYKGRHLQAIYVQLRRGETTQTFPVWYYGEEGTVRGGGLFVGQGTESKLFHFLLPDEGRNYQFLPGKYLLQVYIETTGKSPKKVFEQILVINEQQSQQFKRTQEDITFVWLPSVKEYGTK